MIKMLYPIFQHWSDGGSVWLYSDPHFNDEDCFLMDPHWPTPEEQIAKLNAAVHKNDTLVILGDIGDVSYIPKIKAGRKILIAGNHDVGLSKYKKEKLKRVYNAEDFTHISQLRKQLKKEFPQAKISILETYDFHAPFNRYSVTIDNQMFDEVYGGPLFVGEKIFLSHEPIDLPFGLNIHGHNHSGLGGLSEDGSKFNVCSNCIGYKPQNLSEIIKSGALRNRETIHRLTIDNASKNSIH